MSKITKKIVPVSIIIVWCISLFVCSLCAYADTTQKQIADSVIRLHILANSDSDEDQALKLEVRDYVLGYMRNNIKEGDSSLPSVEFVESIAKQFIAEHGYNYDVHAEYCDTYFPTKEYNGTRFPAGKYRALRILIGEGAGANWWCVMYPPLCMTNAYEGELSDESKAVLEDSMGDKNYELVSSDDDGVAIKFKVVEWYGEISQYIQETFQ